MNMSVIGGIARMCVLMLLCAASWGAGAAGDELNCVLCHKHRGLSRIDENGNFRLFYINEALFEEGPHVRVKCLDCHIDISKIPHEPAKKVDCTTECHLNEPSSKKPFSHKPVGAIVANPPDLVATEKEKYGNYGTKIAPGMLNADGTFRLINGEKERSFVSDYIKNKELLSSVEQSKMKKVIHRMVDEKPLLCEG